MFTLEDVYNRMETGAAGVKRGSFVEPGSAPGSTGRTLDEAMNIAPTVDDTDGAATTDVATGKKYWGIKSGEASTGTMDNVGAQDIAPDTTAQGITQGYHDGTGGVAGDADLITGNIKSGASIFGVPGKTEVVDTTTGDAIAAHILRGKKAWVDGVEITGTAKGKNPYPALMPETGQTTQYDTNDPKADDGAGSGVDLPTPRFTDNSDGTVTDELTGLMWLKDSSCAKAPRLWQTALTDVVELNNSGTMNVSV